MTQPTAAEALYIDKQGKPRVGAQQAAITQVTPLTDSTSPAGTVSDSVITTMTTQDVNDDIASLAAKINEVITQQNLIIEALEKLGAVADN